MNTSDVEGKKNWRLKKYSGEGYAWSRDLETLRRPVQLSSKIQTFVAHAGRTSGSFILAGPGSRVLPRVSELLRYRPPWLSPRLAP
jgi:hypothetical protein